MQLLPDQNFRKTLRYLIYGLVFFIPVLPLIANIHVGFIVLAWLLNGGFKQKFLLLSEPFRRVNAGLFLILFAGLLIGIVYSMNKPDAWFDLQVKLPLIICPVVLASSAVITGRNEIIKLMKIFLAGTFVSSVICFANAFNNYWTTLSTDVFYYKSLSFYHHPSYLALYLCFAIGVILYMLLEKTVSKTSGKILFHSLAAYFSVMIVLLSSKAGVLGLFVVYCIYGLMYVILKKFSRHNIIALLPAVLITLISLLVFPVFTQRFEVARVYIADDQKNVPSDHSVSERMIVWDASIRLISENFMIGVGTGDVKDELYKKYMMMNHKYAAEMKLNAHNQFLQTFISIGFPGFLLIVLILMYPLILSIQRGKVLYLVFLLLIIMNFLVESMLERQEGVLFYAVMNTLLFLWMVDPEDQTEPSSFRKS